MPLTLSLCLYGVFSIWRSGRVDLRRSLAALAQPLSTLSKLLEDAYRVPGTGVFLASHPEYIPSALIRNFQHNKVVHERILILNFQIVDTPRQSQTDRARVQELGPGVFAITARFGFMERLDIARIVNACATRGLRIGGEDTTYYTADPQIVPREPGLWLGWRRALYIFLRRNSREVTTSLGIPADALAKLGMEVPM